MRTASVQALLLALLLLAPAFAARPASAEARAPVIVTPGSARSYRAAIKIFEDASTTVNVERAGIVRTARKLMDGVAFPREY